MSEKMFSIKGTNSVLVTGGSGYIGTHLVLELLKNNYLVTVIDNFSNSYENLITKLAEESNGKLILIKGDIADTELMYSILTKNKIHAVFHLAGVKSIEESVNNPLQYFEINVGGTLKVVQAMERASVFNLIFSSSATVYGEPESLPIRESHPSNRGTNPYGVSKQVAEELLKSLAKSNDRWKIALLRYFNPVGADQNGLIGENPKKQVNNLFPAIAKVAGGDSDAFCIFGNDYDTMDGTAIRDYIHVSDLAEGHIAAMDYISDKNGIFIWNLGTGIGYSVNEIINNFEKITQRCITRKVLPKRNGDVSKSYADTTKATSDLGWKTKRGLNDMVKDAWNWQKNALRLEK
jgi:UDP-glucose 4-epimerase